MTSQPQPSSIREVFAIPCVRRLWIAQVISITGDFLAIFAALSMASFRLHATPAQITGVTLSYMAPLAFFGPVAGTLVDRCSPRSTMIRSDLVRAILAALLPFAAGLGHLYLLLFAISLVSTFFIPAQTITIRTLVPRQGLLAVNTAMQQSILLTRLASPVFAAALVSRFGPVSCFYLDALSFLASAAILTVTTFPPRLVPPASPGILAGIAAGTRFILAHGTISFVIAAISLATFSISCFSPLMSVFVRDLLHAGPQTFGWISTLIGAGTLAGAQAARRYSRKWTPRPVVISSLVVIASGAAGLGVASTAPAACVGAAVLGFGVGLLTAPAQTLVQSETPIAMTGRVSSAVTSLISLAQILGLVLSGLIASTFGLRPVFLLSATLLAVVAFRGAQTRKIPHTSHKAKKAA